MGYQCALYVLSMRCIGDMLICCMALYYSPKGGAPPYRIAEPPGVIRAYVPH
jgi:hypothetical protein